MRDFKPSTWAVLIAMMSLILLPVILMDPEFPANNEPKDDPFGFDHSWRPPANNTPPAKNPKDNTPTDGEPSESESRE